MHENQMLARNRIRSVSSRQCRRCCCGLSDKSCLPNERVRLTDKGIAAIEGKSYVEYDDKEVFFSKGEVYSAYRKIKDIMAQGRTEILVIDPYVDENLLDMLPSLDSSVNIRVLTERPKGDFKLAFRKLQQQRGRVEARTLRSDWHRFTT
jgi:hypothetical protein